MRTGEGTRSAEHPLGLGAGGVMRGSRILETRRARVLRRSQTHTETVVWRALRGRGLDGVKFVHQEPIGPYFADFVCRDKKLVVEIDGATHSTEEELRNDARRTEFLRGNGYRVVRFSNEDVYRNLDGVLDTIYAALNESDPKGPS
jgi:very-short-patch-repair endonuclease